MTTESEETLASLGEPEHTLRQRLREDADTQKIAESLGVDIDDYITQVIFYARRPGLPPQVEVLSDEELEGVDLPTEGEVDQWLDAVASGEIDLSGPETGVQAETRYTTEVDRSQRLREAAMGGAVERRAPTMPAPGPGPARPASILEQQVLQQQRQARNRAEVRQSVSSQSEPKK